MKKSRVVTIVALSGLVAISFEITSVHLSGEASTKYKVVKTHRYSLKSPYHTKTNKQAYLWNADHTIKLKNLQKHPKITWYRIQAVTLKRGNQRAVYYQVRTKNNKAKGYIWHGYLKPGFKTAYHRVKVKKYRDARAYHLNTKKSVYVWNASHTKMLHNLKNISKRTWYRTEVVTLRQGKHKSVYFKVHDRHNKVVGYVWHGYLTANVVSKTKTPTNTSKNSSENRGYKLLQVNQSSPKSVRHNNTQSIVTGRVKETDKRALNARESSTTTSSSSVVASNAMSSSSVATSTATSSSSAVASTATSSSSVATSTATSSSSAVTSTATSSSSVATSTATSFSSAVTSTATSSSSVATSTTTSSSSAVASTATSSSSAVASTAASSSSAVASTATSSSSVATSIATSSSSAVASTAASSSSAVASTATSSSSVATSTTTSSSSAVASTATSSSSSVASGGTDSSNASSTDDTQSKANIVGEDEMYADEGYQGSNNYVLSDTTDWSGAMPLWGWMNGAENSENFDTDDTRYAMSDDVLNAAGVTFSSKGGGLILGQSILAPLALSAQYYKHLATDSIKLNADEKQIIEAIKAEKDKVTLEDIDRSKSLILNIHALNRDSDMLAAQDDKLIRSLIGQDYVINPLDSSGAWMMQFAFTNPKILNLMDVTDIDKIQDDQFVKQLTKIFQPRVTYINLNTGIASFVQNNLSPVKENFGSIDGEPGLVYNANWHVSTYFNGEKLSYADVINEKDRDAFVNYALTFYNHYNKGTILQKRPELSLQQIKKNINDEPYSILYADNGIYYVLKFGDKNNVGNRIGFRIPTSYINRAMLPDSDLIDIDALNGKPLESDDSADLSSIVDELKKTLNDDYTQNMKDSNFQAVVAADSRELFVKKGLEMFLESISNVKNSGKKTVGMSDRDAKIEKALTKIKPYISKSVDLFENSATFQKYSDGINKLTNYNSTLKLLLGATGTIPFYAIPGGVNSLNPFSELYQDFESATLYGDKYQKLLKKAIIGDSNVIGKLAAIQHTEKQITKNAQADLNDVVDSLYDQANDRNYRLVQEALILIDGPKGIATDVVLQGFVKVLSDAFTHWQFATIASNGSFEELENISENDHFLKNFGKGMISIFYNTKDNTLNSISNIMGTLFDFKIDNKSEDEIHKMVTDKAKDYLNGLFSEVVENGIKESKKDIVNLTTQYVWNGTVANNKIDANNLKNVFEVSGMYR